MRFKLLIFCLLLPSLAYATNYTVKSSGGSFTTFTACAAVAVGGDTCIAFGSASPQTGWTQPTSGSAGNVITFTKNPGDTVVITSTVTVNNRSYITFSGGLAFSAVTAIAGNSSTQHVTIDSNSFTGNGNNFRIPDSAGSGGSDNVFSNNTITRNSGVAGGSTTSPSVYLFGDRNRVENNTIVGGSSDFIEAGGTNVVVRNNYFHDINGSTSLEHIDFIQGIGSTLPALSFSLIENNIEKNCVNQCHFVQLRGGAGAIDDTVITRFNYAQNLDSLFAGYGDHSDGAATVPNGFVYNNTSATEAVRAENGDGAGFDSGFGTALNNIFYNTEAGSWSPTIFSQGGLGKGNLTFTTGYAGVWNAPYSSETTYAALRNQNPLFANYPTDGTLQSGSPARTVGVKLTSAVGTGSSSVALTVGDAHGLQPGWAGVNADWIRIGTATTRQIASINYSTNVITLASSATWANGDAIYLYKNSIGTVVLNSASPDLGAFPYTAAPAPVISLSPSSLAFGSINTLSSSAPQTVTVTNVGTATAHISGITFTTGTQYSKTTTCGATLTASASCTVSVTFSPLTNGVKNDTLNFADDASGSPQTVSLSGTGTTAPPPGPSANTSTNLPDQLLAGAQFMGMTAYKNNLPAGQTTIQNTPSLGFAPTVVPTWCRIWNLDSTQPNAIATARGTYVWTSLDAVLDRCAGSGQRIEWVAAVWPTWVTGNTTHPCWTTLGACDPPSDWNTSAACMGTLAGQTTDNCKAREILADVLLHASARGTPITAISVGNETNFCDSVSTADAACHVTAEVEWTGTIAQHVKLSRGLQITAKAVQPGIWVWGPSVSAMSLGTCTSGVGGQRWLDRWYLEWANQAYPVLEGVTFHGYTSSSGSWTSPELVDDMLARATNGTSATGTIYATCSNTQGMLNLGAYLVDDEDSWGAQTMAGVPVRTISRAGNTVTLVTWADGAFSISDSLIVPQIDGCGTGAPWNGTVTLTGVSTTTLTYTQTGTDQTTCTPTNVPLVVNTDNNTLQSNYMRKLLIEYSRAVKYKLWFTMYTNSSASGFWGTLCAARTSTVCQQLTGGGQAWGEIYKWIGSVSPTAKCSVTGTVWTCNYQRSGGYKAQAVWDTAGASSYTYPVIYHQYRDLSGATTSLAPATVGISASPILLEAPALPAPAVRKAIIMGKALPDPGISCDDDPSSQTVCYLSKVRATCDLRGTTLWCLPIVQ